MPHRKRKVTTITLDPEVVEKAKKHGLNISRLSESSLKESIEKLERGDGAPKVKKGGEKEMANKLPWVAAAVLIAAAVGVGAILNQSAAPTNATISVPRGGVLIAAGIPTYSGIENIYIVENTHAAGWNINFSGNENVLGTITGTGLTASIPYNTPFRIVVAVKGAHENMAYVQKENLQVELAASGSFTIPQENSSNANEYVFAESAGVYIRVNAVWDNNGAGYTLPAGGSVSLNPVKLWCWS
jgi:hypothetical protein